MNVFAKSSEYEWTHLCDSGEVPIDMDDAEVVMQRGLGDDEVGNRDAVPKPVVVREISLEV